MSEDKTVEEVDKASKDTAAEETQAIEEAQAEFTSIDASIVCLTMTNGETGEEGKINLPTLFNQMFNDFGEFHARLLKVEEYLSKQAEKDSPIIKI